MGIYSLVIKDECINDIVDFAGTSGFIFGVQVLIDTVDTHVFTDTEINKEEIT